MAQPGKPGAGRPTRSAGPCVSGALLPWTRTPCARRVVGPARGGRRRAPPLFLADAGRSGQEVRTPGLKHRRRRVSRLFGQPSRTMDRRRNPAQAAPHTAGDRRAPNPRVVAAASRWRKLRQGNCASHGMSPAKPRPARACGRGPRRGRPELVPVARTGRLTAPAPAAMRGHRPRAGARIRRPCERATAHRLRA